MCKQELLIHDFYFHMFKNQDIIHNIQHSTMFHWESVNWPGLSAQLHVPQQLHPNFLASREISDHLKMIELHVNAIVQSEYRHMNTNLETYSLN